MFFLLIAIAYSGRFWQPSRFQLQKAQFALGIGITDAEMAMAIGNYYFNTLRDGTYDLDIAQKAFAKAVAIDPGILWGHYQLARIHHLRGESDEALSEIEQELEANPENLRSLYVRGLVYGYRNLPGDLARAEADFKRFIAWAPAEWAGYTDLAWILAREGKYAEVEQVIEESMARVSEAGSNPWLWNSLGVAQLNLGRYAEASASFEKAKRAAEALPDEEWIAANPGLKPEKALEGKTVFIQVVAENLAKAADMMGITSEEKGVPGD